MNILNYDEIQITSLKEVIEKQKEIMIAFEPDLEKRIKEFDIDIPEDQMLLKDFLLIRVVEEITEASIALNKDHYEHFKEEIVDVFNFLIEAAILLNKIKEPIEALDHYNYTCPERPDAFLEIQNNLKYSYIRNIRSKMFDLIEAIGDFTNKLKLRPWRESQYPVDILSFNECYKSIWNSFIILLEYGHISLEDLLVVWSKKYQVNKFRIESNY